MKKVAIYARVSTVAPKALREEGKGQDPETQLIPLREYIEQRGFTLFEEYIDRGQSGAKDNRPALNRMMQDARRRKFDVLLVWKFDRFARSTRHLINTLDELNSLGIDFVSLTEAIDTSTPMGKMVFTIFGAVAEFERELIRERILAGHVRAARKGKYPGRPKAVLNMPEIMGYRRRGHSISAISDFTGHAASTIADRIREYERKHGPVEPA